MTVTAYNVLYITSNIVTMIVPMKTQLSCLIFGWIRHRREAREANPRQQSEPEREVFGAVKYVKEVVRPDYISYYDPTVEYYIKDVMQYLPERR